VFSPGQVQWVNQLEVERENLALATGWALRSGAGTAALRLVAALSWFWLIRGHYHEARELSTEILSSAAAKERTPARAKALNNAAAVRWAIDRHADVQPLLREALDIASETGTA